MADPFLVDLVRRVESSWPSASLISETPILFLVGSLQIYGHLVASAMWKAESVLPDEFGAASAALHDPTAVTPTHAHLFDCTMVFPDDARQFLRTLRIDLDQVAAFAVQEVPFL